MNSSWLLHLLQLSDPTLPIGSFSHSMGLETYVQQGIVHDKKTALDFIHGQLAHNLFFTDAAFVSLAFDAAASKDENALWGLDEECTAVKLSREMRQASQKLGVRLLKVFSPLCQNSFAESYKAMVECGKATAHYSLVFGVYAQVLEIPKPEALTAFFYNAAAGMVTNSVKLIPLGQQEGQEMLFSLRHLITDLAANALLPDLALIGLCATGFDLRCMQHEALYSRLYMS